MYWCVYLFELVCSFLCFKSASRCLSVKQKYLIIEYLCQDECLICLALLNLVGMLLNIRVVYFFAL